MKIAAIENDIQAREGIHMKEHIAHSWGHPHPGLPHERKGMIALRLDEHDWKVFMAAFGDEDTAAAAVDIVHGAPPEIQILVAQILDMIEKEEM